MENDNKSTPQDVAPAPTPESEKKTEESKLVPEPDRKDVETPTKEELTAFRKWQV